MNSLAVLKKILLISTLISSVAFASEDCAQTRSGISGGVNTVINSFSGIDSLLGSWKLGGLAGAVKSVKISLTESADKFFVSSKEGESKQVHLCVTTEQPDVLRIKVLAPKNPKAGLILVKPSGSKSISVAADGSGWKFMGFKKTN